MARCTSFVAPRRCTSVQLTYVCFSIVILYRFWHGKNHQLKPPFKGNCCFCWIQASQAIPSCFGLFWVISLGGFCLVYIYPEPFGGYIWSLYPIRSPLFRRWSLVCFGSNYSCKTVLMTAKMRFFCYILFLAQNVAPKESRDHRRLGINESSIHFGEGLFSFCEMMGSLSEFQSMDFQGWRLWRFIGWKRMESRKSVLHGWWFCHKIILKKPCWLNLFEVSKAFHACHLGGKLSGHLLC